MSLAGINALVAALACAGILCGPASAAEPAGPAGTLAQPSPVLTDVWAVRLAPGTDPAVVASRLGAVNYRPLGKLRGYYLFEIPPGAQLSGEGETTQRIRSEAGVQWAERQVARQRHPRLPADPLFPLQWHLNNLGQTGGVVGEDIHVLPAWAAGYSGSGIVIGIVDNGLQHTHPDLAQNYLPSASWDFNGGDADPAPGPADLHGTAVAGLAAARDDGASCGVGVAYRAQLAGLRLIAAPSTDAQEAEALTYANDVIHIYSNSWGPLDDGQRLEGPGPLTRQALLDGVTSGRQGRGSIYVWAGGNGNGNHDNVNYDGYANSRYVIAVGAVDHNGLQSFYSEPGAPLLLTAPSSGELVGITTTDLLGTDGYNGSASPGGDCTSGFGGTSAAAPQVAGVAALMLEANVALGWRDVKHILLATAKKTDIASPGWHLNGAGRAVHYGYGYGRVDAAAAVTAARRQVRNLGAEESLDSGAIVVNQAIPDNDATGVTSDFLVERNLIVEGVEVVFSTTHPRRGDLQVVLTSPSGTESVLAEPHQDSNADYDNWSFTSMRHWGESSAGRWQVRVMDSVAGNSGTFDHWQLVFHGHRPAFADVAVSGDLWRGIEAINQAGLTAGCGSGNYCPNDPTTRAQMAVFLERGLRGAADVPPGCTGAVFSDVSAATFACDWIEQLGRDGLTRGCGAGRYCPDDAVTRLQAAVFLLRARHGANYTPPACTGAVFSDVPATNPYCGWIEQLAAEHITAGCGAGAYCPDQPATRVQMATLLARTFALVTP
jgi:subtilisin-like proprotein convertase family protein